MVEETYEMALLLDFYGELLTEKQRRYLDQYYNEDFSLSEIAENEGITRQGVRELLVRSKAKLINTEEKTGLINRFTQLTALNRKALELTLELKPHIVGQGEEILSELFSTLKQMQETAFAD